jgi:hypothetical protein
MTYPDKKWVNVKKNGMKLELIIKDQDWKRVDVIKCTSKEFPQVLSDIERRFGIPTKKQAPTELRKEVDEELSFLSKETHW